MEENYQEKIMQDTNELKKDIGALTEESVSQLAKGIEKLTGKAKEKLMGVVDTAKEEVGYGLSKYNTKAQELAEKVPGSIGKKAAEYPWVAISVGLILGVVLGVVLKPSRKF